MTEWKVETDERTDEHGRLHYFPANAVSDQGNMSAMVVFARACVRGSGAVRRKDGVTPRAIDRDGDHARSDILG